MPIPLVDVRAQYAPLLEELRGEFDDVLERGQFILGAKVEAFEREAAEYLGVAHALGVANGTDAIVLALDALEIGPGDEVICPSFTFFATAEAVRRVGASPVFADIDPATLNLDAASVAAHVTGKTRGIVAVHLFGRPARIDELPAGIPVVEDAAQAFGARVDGRPVGSVGVAGTFSFFPTKNLFCLGDGGLVSTNDPELAGVVDLLRRRGSPDGKRTFVDERGFNSRLDELQAAFLRVFLSRVEEWNAARREAAARYEELGLGELCELPADEPGHVYHAYVVRSPERDRIAAALAAEGIATARHYVTPLHGQPAFAALGCAEAALPETELAATENLGLPIWAGIDASVQEQVVEVVRDSIAAPVRR
jgi:UDP-N-acetyl-3-dehydro-alpha-D-glucosamine 3-aminotranferase